MRVFGQTVLQKVSCGSLCWATAVPVTVRLFFGQPCLTEVKKDFHPSSQLSGSRIALWENKLFKKWYVVSKRERTHCRVVT